MGPNQCWGSYSSPVWARWAISAPQAAAIAFVRYRLDLPSTKFVERLREEKKVLIVDDVADTGKSLKLVKEHVMQQGAKEARTATMYYKPWSLVNPDYYEKETRLWIVFPWEMRETIRKIVEKRRGKDAPIEKETAKLVKAGLPKHLAERFLKEMFEERIC